MLGPAVAAAAAFQAAEAIIQSVLAAHDPVCGGFAYHFHRSTGDCGGNLFDSVEAADRVAAAAALLSDKN